MCDENISCRTFQASEKNFNVSTEDEMRLCIFTDSKKVNSGKKEKITSELKFENTQPVQILNFSLANITLSLSCYFILYLND